MIDYNRILHRTSIQELRSFFLEGMDIAEDERELNAKSYEERIHKGERPLMEFIENLYPDGNVREAVSQLVSDAILVNQEIYTEIGMKVGAQIIYELLQNGSAKELCYGEDNKER